MMILATFIHGMALRFYAAQHTRLSKKKLLLFTYLHDAYILNDHYRYLHMCMVALQRVLFSCPRFSPDRIPVVVFPTADVGRYLPWSSVAPAPTADPLMVSGPILCLRLLQQPWEASRYSASVSGNTVLLPHTVGYIPRYPPQIPKQRFRFVKPP